MMYCQSPLEKNLSKNKELQMNILLSWLKSVLATFGYVFYAIIPSDFGPDTQKSLMI